MACAEVATAKAKAVTAINLIMFSSNGQPHVSIPPGNIWARPGHDLEIICDKDGYASLDSANKALKDTNVRCKNLVGTGAEAKFKAAHAKAEKLGGGASSPARTSSA